MALDNPSYFSIANPPPLCSLSSSLSSSSSCSSPRSQTKRSLRSLLRSLSTNSADSNHELFNTGAPRLSDIAPEFKHPLDGPRRANSLKTTRKHASHRRSGGVYAPLSQQDTFRSDDEEQDEDEVFIAHEEDASVRYYNVKSEQQVAPRRHSISALRSTQVTTVADIDLSSSSAIDRPIIEAQSALNTAQHIIDDHKLRHGSYPRKRCNRCPRGVTKRTDMEDILILSAKESEPANLWAQYFASYFDQMSQNANRKPYKIKHLGVEEVIANNGDVRLIAERSTSVKLQIVILCPLLLEKIQENHQMCTNGLAKLLFPDRILALQLGTSDSDITELHKEAFPSYQQWQRRPVGQDQDQNFALDFVGTAIAIFTKVWKQQSSIASEENSQFSISPKKIRYGQTSVLILLEYPLLHEDIVKISIVKNEEMTEIKSVKRRNPYTLKFTIPETFLEVSAIVNILVEKNGSFIGKRPIKCESRLRELEQILRSTSSPVEFMCQSLGFSPHDKEQLDNWLVHMFQKNVPPNFGIFNNDTPSGGKHVCELFPTLLHFSARFGLEKLTAQLLDCPGGDLACEIRNVQDFTPADIAENMGHKEINNMLRGYMKMNELAIVYTKIKKLTTENLPNSSKEANEKPEEHYVVPKKPQELQLEEFYKMCPAPKPIVLPFQSNSAPCTPHVEEQQQTLTQYIAMDQQNPQQVHEETFQNNLYQNLQLGLDEIVLLNEAIQTQTYDDNALSMPQQPKQKHYLSMQSIHSKNSSASKISVNEDKVQVELAEIINDFKNNVHTIAQTEQLVAEWQNRNDVQKSFKEKQEQLQEMRERYERIQRDMKHTGGRKSSPFERFKKLFGFSSHNNVNQIEQKETVNGKVLLNSSQSLPVEGPNQMRPISSLSLQSTASSTSSGRMSTISGSSLGDSGTHSDHDERKIILTPTDEDLKATSANGFNNYLIPPAPRPIKTPLMMSQSFPTIDERSGRELDAFYIQFPPNGLPVASSGVPGRSSSNSSASNEIKVNEIKTEQQEYMNLPGSCNGSHDAKDFTSTQHDYMNFRSVS